MKRYIIRLLSPGISTAYYAGDLIEPSKQLTTNIGLASLFYTSDKAMPIAAYLHRNIKEYSHVFIEEVEVTVVYPKEIR